jgi:hypothetical protein
MRSSSISSKLTTIPVPSSIAAVETTRVPFFSLDTSNSFLSFAPWAEYGGSDGTPVTDGITAIQYN